MTALRWHQRNRRAAARREFIGNIGFTLVRVRYDESVDAGWADDRKILLLGFLHSVKRAREQ